MIHKIKIFYVKMSSLNPTTIGYISLFANEPSLSNISLSGRSRDILEVRRAKFEKDLFDLHYRDLIWKYRYSLIFLRRIFNVNPNEAIYWMAKYRMDDQLDYCFHMMKFKYNMSSEQIELFHMYGMNKCILRFNGDIISYYEREIISLLISYITGFIKENGESNDVEDTILLTLLDSYMPHITTDYHRLQWVCFIYAAISFAGFNTPHMEHTLFNHAMFKYDKRTDVRRDDIEDRFRLIDRHIACIMNDFDGFNSIEYDMYFQWSMRIFVMYVLPKVKVSNKVIDILYELEVIENDNYSVFEIFNTPLIALIIKNGNIRSFDHYMKISEDDINFTIVEVTMENNVELMRHILTNYKLEPEVVYSTYLTYRSEYMNGIESWMLLWNFTGGLSKELSVETTNMQFQIIKYLFEMYPKDSLSLSVQTLLKKFRKSKNFVLYLWLISEHPDLMSEENMLLGGNGVLW
jgi:hypothetical protein